MLRDRNYEKGCWKTVTIEKSAKLSYHYCPFAKLQTIDLPWQWYSINDLALKNWTNGQTDKIILTIDTNTLYKVWKLESKLLTMNEIDIRNGQDRFIKI